MRSGVRASFGMAATKVKSGEWLAIQVLVKMDTMAVASPNECRIRHWLSVGTTDKSKVGKGRQVNTHWMRSAVRLKQMCSNQLYCDNTILCCGDSRILSGPIVLQTVKRSSTTLV